MEKARILGIFIASALSLVGGVLVAVTFEGWLRLLFAILAFTGYVVFFSHAFRDLLPGDLVESNPDPERGRARETSLSHQRKAHLTAA